MASFGGGASSQWDDDPWSRVEDIEGTAHYDTLEVQPAATPAELKKAFRRLARLHHPDKGGDAQRFAKIQSSFKVLMAAALGGLDLDRLRETARRVVDSRVL